MSLKEAAAVRPLRIAVVTVRAGDTQERLAQRMAVPERPLDTFRVLNGLSPNEPLLPGRKLKLVVE
jgi:predicted Zn-dependent protease